MKPSRTGRALGLALEQLEDRCTPAVSLGIPWADPVHLTLSFAPDATAIAGHQSSLFATLGANRAAADWQSDILRAFQTWAAQANIDIGVVADDGEAFGVAGRAQGESRFGDIRVAAQPMSPDVLATSVPYDPFASGTWAGDVFLNSDHKFTSADLFPILLHEAAHVLGLDHSTDPASPRFPSLNMRAALTGRDVTDLQAIYGTRLPDAAEGSNGNDTFKNATRLKAEPADGFTGDTPLVQFGDITTTRDTDVFALREFPAYTGPMTFRLQTAGLSVLAPKLTVYDAAGRVLGQALSTNAAGDAVTVTLPRTDPLATYFVRVEGATRDVFGVGRYALAVTFDNLNKVSAAGLQTVLRGPYDNLKPDELLKLFRNPGKTFFNDDQHTNETTATATALRATPGFVANTHYETAGSLSDAADVDVYQIKSAQTQGGQATVMTVTALADAVNGVLPVVTVFDARLNPVAAEILVNGNGTFTLQVPNAVANATYYLRARAGVAGATGNYHLTVGFGQRAEDFVTFASGSLAQTSRQDSYNFYVAQTQLFDFALSASALPAGVTGGVRMTIWDAQGNARYTLTALAGQTVSDRSLFLPPGAYTVTYSAVGTPPTASLGYTLRGKALSDPIGPVRGDTTLTGQYQSATSPGVFVYPGNTTSTTPYLWVFSPPPPRH